MGFLFVFWFACACFAATVASSKGHEAPSWFLGGLFFGPLGLISAAGLPDLVARKYLMMIAGEREIEPEAQSTPPPPPPPPVTRTEVDEQRRRILGG